MDAEHEWNHQAFKDMIWKAKERWMYEEELKWNEVPVDAAE